MSESDNEIESLVITSEEKPKEKDPKRVAAGKRLAAISKEAKEAKRQRLLREEETPWKNYAIISIGFCVLGYAGYVYASKYFTQEKTPELKKVHFEESPKRGDVEAEKKTRGKPISMFD